MKRTYIVEIDAPDTLRDYDLIAIINHWVDDSGGLTKVGEHQEIELPYTAARNVLDHYLTS